MTKLKSLKTRMLVYVGVLITTLMVLISISVLFQWRSLILSNQRQNALSVAQTFAVSILDALIYQESGLMHNEGFIENHIHNFLNKNPQIKFVTIHDQRGHVMVRSSYDENESVRSDWRHFLLAGQQDGTMQIYHSDLHGWILEVNLPLQIHSKSWGALRLGFDVEPTRKKLQEMFFLLSAFTIITALIILTVIYFLIDRLTKSLRQLVAEMNRFDLENIQPVQIQTQEDEVGVLLANFEKMKQRLALSRKQLLDAQRQIYNAEKLASIGRLASGVAHEINNPLQGLKSCLFTIEKEPANHAQTRAYLALANEGLDHIAVIVQKLLGFSRQHAKQITRVDLNDNIEKVLSLLAYRLEKADIAIELELDDRLPPLEADTHLIQEVIMNLLLNSFDSMENGGTLKITTTARENAVCLSVSDSGCGIPETNLDRIFDPFFSTKEEGKGTGLGLSVALGIVEAHGGTITVASHEGEGTTFEVILPLQGGL